MRSATSIVASGLMFSFAGVSTIGAPAGHANGTASFDKHTATIRYGWLVRGPGEFDRKQSIFRVYFSSTNIGAKIQACDSLSCLDESLVDGAFVEFGDASNVNYWVTLGGGGVQFSGGTNAKALVLTTNAPNHIAGKVRIDDTSFHGATLDVSFDLPLLKTFRK
jgi:hypothetical protein